MTKQLIILLSFCCIVFTSCITDSSGDGDNNNDSILATNVQASKYIPLRTGATYTYQETLLRNGIPSGWGIGWSFNDPLTYDITMVVGAQTKKNGKTYYNLATQYPEFDYWTDEIIGTDTDTTYYRLSDDILYTFEITEDEEYRYVEVEIPKIDFNTYNWVITTNSLMGDNWYYTVLWTGSYFGQESVTVPAGTFHDCAVFKLIYIEDGYNTYIYKVDGEVKEPYTDVTTTKIWYAPGVGMVKTQVSADHVSDEERLREITTTELKSYDIP